MPASFHSFTTRGTAKGIIRHAGPSVKTHPEFGFLSGTAFVAQGGPGDKRQLRSFILPVSWMHCTLHGFPGDPFAQCRKCRTPQKTMAMSNRSAAAMTSASRTEPPG